MHRSEKRLSQMAERDTARRMTVDFPLGTDAASVRRRVEALERLLERAIVVPGINRSVGLDAIIGLVPVVGDLIVGGLALYLVWEARNLGMSKWQRARMLANIGFDTLVGSVPIAGDLFDFVFRSSSRNLRIISRYLDKHHPETRIIDG
jgi:hypothetical protein